MEDKPAYSAWYSTARWQRLRLSILKRDGFTCAMCGRPGTSPELVADHVKPHKGDPLKFWDASNLQTLCASPCHNLVKQSMEKGGNKQAPRAVGVDGWPA